jgi:hypothetical protein
VRDVIDQMKLGNRGATQKVLRGKVRHLTGGRGLLGSTEYWHSSISTVVAERPVQKLVNLQQLQ